MQSEAEYFCENVCGLGMKEIKFVNGNLNDFSCDHFHAHFFGILILL